MDEDFEKIKKRLQKYILKDGKVVPVSLMEWADWFHNNYEERVIDRTKIADDDAEFVSTIFLGIDHNFCSMDWDDENYQPTLFETCIFSNDQKYSGKIYRWQSLADAKRGHWMIVDCVRKGEDIDVAFSDPSVMNFLFDLFRENEDENLD